MQDNIDLLEQEIRNNNQIITRLRELKLYIKNRLDNNYLQSLEKELSILENRLLSSFNQLTEKKHNTINYLDNFNSKKSATQLLVQVLDWFKEKNRLFSYNIYSLTKKEYGIIDQLLKSYYKSQHSLTPPPQTDQRQQQFRVKLNECIDIKELIDTRPLLCYPIINSYKFFDLPKHPIVDPINNSQLDLFINSKTTPRSVSENDNNDNSIDNVFVIRYKVYHFTRLFYYISKSKFQFNYLFFVKTLGDYKNILIKLDKNFSHLVIVDDRQLIDLFNSNIRNLTSALIVYHSQFYDKYKYEIQYNYSNIKTIIITSFHSNFKANHPNVNIFGEYVLERLSTEGLELLFNNLTDSIVSKDDIFYKPLMYSITKIPLVFMIEDLTKHIKNKTKTPNEIIYDILSIEANTMAPSTIIPGFKSKNIIFKFPVGEMLWSLKVNYFESQTKQNNEWVPITIMQEPNECTDPYQLILTSEYAQIIINNTNGDIYNIKFDLFFNKACSRFGGECINLIPLSGTFKSPSHGIQSLSLSNCFGSILHRPYMSDERVPKIEIDAIGYSFSKNNNQTSEKRIAIRLEDGEKKINFINIEGNNHFIGDVKFLNDTDYTLIIISNYSRFANNNQLIFKSKDNQPFPDRGNFSGNLCGDIILKDATIISFDISAFLSMGKRNKI
ncbi:hypothetical protein CYY_006995 [Polysphondylium violaceum]|uniref:Uncharacterized protein n=1 Tax=Polysphondylium violaceum TaxID=133409 RepID=A0A8J4PP95_9MYCE|nr:hypothetical protein CYY_006995 [Polysphondylium violaceum]